jgi:hypothetical protein
MKLQRALEMGHERGHEFERLLAEGMIVSRVHGHQRLVVGGRLDHRRQTIADFKASAVVVVKRGLPEIGPGDEFLTGHDRPDGQLV